MLDIDETTAARLRYLRPGTSLRLTPLGDPIGGYAASVVEVDDGAIWIDQPIRRDGMLQLEPGEMLAVRFERPDDAVYVFDTVVAEFRRDDRAPFGLGLPVTVDRRAQRGDARLPLVLPASLRTDGVEGEAKLVDLSAGGVGVVFERELAEGTEVTVTFDLPGPEGDTAIERRAVVRTVAMYGRTPGGATLHHYGLAFVDADDELREQILASVIWNLTRNPHVW
ncbi:MAG: flagellar brake protein [Acidimicrobiia bacterium]